MLTCGTFKNFHQPGQNILYGGLTQIRALQSQRRNSAGSWIRSEDDRAKTFASNLQCVFQPNPVDGSAIFFDVSQAFDRVWLDRLMHKIKTYLPDYTHKLRESYLYNRIFAVRCNTTTSDDYIIEVIQRISLRTSS